MFHHKRSLFPLVVALLTIALLAFMAYAFSHRAPAQESGEIRLSAPEEPVVTPEMYRENVREILRPFDDAYLSEADDLGRLRVTEETLNALLAERVPSAYRDFHLELAFAFNRMSQGLRNEDQRDEAAAGLARVRDIIQSTPWLQ